MAVVDFVSNLTTEMTSDNYLLLSNLVLYWTRKLKPEKNKIAQLQNQKPNIFFKLDNYIFRIKEINSNFSNVIN